MAGTQARPSTQPLPHEPLASAMGCLCWRPRASPPRTMVRRFTVSRFPLRSLFRPGRAPTALLLALAFATVACGGGEEAAPATSTPTVAATTSAPAFPLIVTDSSNTAVTIQAPPQRIISYSPGATEILFAIGASERVVAVDKFSDYPEQAKRLPKLEYSDPNPEAALAHQPDLVLFATRQRDQVKPFRDLKLNVLYQQEASSIDGVYEQIILLGRVTGNSEQAQRVVAQMRTRIEAVTQGVADVPQGPRVFYEVTKDLYTAAPNTFIGGMFIAIKARNIAAGAPSPFPQLTAEAVIAADPEVVMLGDAAFGESYDTVAKRPGWAAVSAVKNRRVYAIDTNIVDRPGPRIADGIEALARALYPDRFK
ncbi:MAG: ABC transporter substrate-binding protein [Dehalococcoidia bacterium]|nr:ABC transporter substrate-binding protein [Dehalococcoidia bacterium]